MAAFSTTRLGAIALLLAVPVAVRASDAASGAATAQTHKAMGTQSISTAEFGANVQRLQALTASCSAQASACDDAAVGEDQRVGELADGGYIVHWDWLRDALHRAKAAKPVDREQSMRDAGEHLGDLAQEIGVSAKASAPDFQRARAAADRVLRDPEFEGDGGPTWWDRKQAQMYGWLASLFNGVTRLGEMAPWLGRLLEWLLFLGAAAGLVVFLLRTLARQRMRIALGAGGPIASAWQRDATDWATRAQQHADRSEWREAVHCLYWAAIVLLEARRAWRHNPTRTPREYVRLLKPGSTQHQGLRGLTQIFERIWYGQREADGDEYQRARAYFAQLESSASTTAPATVADPAGVTA